MKRNYEQTIKVIKSVIADETNFYANMANVSAILMAEFNFHWVGFYLVDKIQNNLVLGPFQGPLACTRIPFGKGVCGSAWKESKSFLVDDVHQFPGHIACSSLSNSEIVIPLIQNSGVIGVLDIDSCHYSDFDANDKLSLEIISSILSDSYISGAF